VQLGSFDLLLPDDERLWVFTRTLGEEKLLVVANMTSSLASVPMAELPDIEDARLLLTNLSTGQDLQTLQPWEARVYALSS